MVTPTRPSPVQQLDDVITTSVEVISPDAKIAEAARKMMELDVGALPVCKDGRLVGMVTDRDIVVRAVATNLDLGQTSVGVVMSSPVIYCFDHQDVRDVARLMEEKRVRRIVVLDRDKKLVGIVSISDLAIEPKNVRLVGEVLQTLYDTTRTAAA